MFVFQIHLITLKCYMFCKIYNKLVFVLNKRLNLHMHLTNAQNMTIFTNCVQKNIISSNYLHFKAGIGHTEPVLENINFSCTAQKHSSVAISIQFGYRCQYNTTEF